MSFMNPLRPTRVAACRSSPRSCAPTDVRATFRHRHRHRRMPGDRDNRSSRPRGRSPFTRSDRRSRSNAVVGTDRHARIVLPVAAYRISDNGYPTTDLRQRLSESDETRKHDRDQPCGASSTSRIRNGATSPSESRDVTFCSPAASTIALPSLRCRRLTWQRDRREQIGFAGDRHESRVTLAAVVGDE